MVYRLVIEQSQKKEDQISLSPEQKHYLQRVLRLKSGDRFIVMDGKGSSWLAELITTGGKIIEPVVCNTELPINVTLMVALPKGSGFEEIVRCGTELGVNQFMPVISERTLLKPQENKLQRWRKIAIEAAEQSERQFVPHICAPVAFNQAITEIYNLTSYCYVAVTRSAVPSLWTKIENISHAHHILIATGPEGGWTDLEIEKAIANGFQPVSLGKRILRAVTAPIMAMSIIAAMSEI